MFTTFKGLKPFQLSEYIFLTLFAFFIPISWRIATFLMIGLFICCILKGIFEDGFKINLLQYNNKVVYFIFIAFWLIYAISFLYSENSTEARIQIGKKLSFFLFPLFFLCSNLSYLYKNRVRMIMYCFVYGILVLFIANFIWAVYDILFENVDMKRLISHHQFFKTNENDMILPSIHRAYLSIFSFTALVFCCVEFFKYKHFKIFNAITITILIFIPFFLTSRAGILCTCLISFFIWFWIIFSLKKHKIGIITGLIFATLLTASYFAFPKSIDKFTKAINNIKNGKGDTRITLRLGVRNAIYDNFIFGSGVGDRNDETMKSFQKYKDYIISKIKPIEHTDLNINKIQIIFQDSICKYEHKYLEYAYQYADSIINKNKYDDSPIKEYLSEYRIIKHCMKYEMNAHNQFSDTIIAVGIIGLLLLLGMFFVPIYLWIKYRKFDIIFFSLIFIFAFNSLFESVFERQMGIMFFTFFYFLLFHGFFCQQTTNDSQQTL